MDPKPTKSALEMLPVEARQAIMCAITTIESLRSMALACSSSFHAFKDAELLITTQVLLKEVGLDVLPEAIAALESSRTDSWSRQKAADFISRHLRNRKIPPLSWTLSDALSMSKLYHHVRFFATDFATKTLASVPFEREAAPPSQAEIARIERAFYRYEIYCNVFRDYKHPLYSLEEQKEKVFSNFSPWENEQLACIHDYLFRLISPAFNEIAEHDIMWGEFNADYADISEPAIVEPILARGLSSIHSIVLADTYEDRYRLFYPDYVAYTSHFLFEAMNAANGRGDGLWLEDYTTDDELARITSPFFPDLDKGPADIWRWAHQEDSWAHFVNSPTRRSLREWGYVMWDRSRLDEMSIFSTPWEESEDPPLTADEIRRMVQREESLNRRSEIYMRGGRGWWSFEDESRVVWPPPVRRAPSKPEPKQVKSLSEAKELILSLRIPP